MKDACRWEDVYKIAKKAFDLFPLVVIRSLPQIDQQKCLEAFSGFGSLAAAAALEAQKSPEEALILLEKGRDIIAGNRFDTRIDLTELRSIDKDLAEEFEKLRAQLDPSGVHAYMINTGRSEEPGAKDPSGRLLRANRRLEEVVNKIRDKEGCKEFLMPPDLNQMKDAAGNGSIVVINIAEWRCDAIIVRKDREVESIQLCGLTQKAITQQLGDAPSYKEIGLGITDYSAFLIFLWQYISYPVLTKLGYTADLPESTPVEDYPRVWWCSTGNASRLPLHAASSWRQAGLPRGNVMNRVISSYTSSIKALIFSRRQAILRRTSCQRGSRALLCSVLSTLHDQKWGLSSLANAPVEVKAVGKLITETMPTNIPSPDNARGTIAKLNELPAIFHFAGHGVTDPIDPSKSCLYTKDSPLYVEKLVRVGMYKRFPLLAYLSACSTGVNVVNGKAGLGDEGIHVMGALQLAGFVGVVGALWRIPDDTAGRVAKTFYERLLQGDWEEEDRVARCLHYAVMSLKKTTDRNLLAVSIK
ncbi:CHAT domain-containing protein [Tirmania nivea]|nr:CHAT domain-containing protein [Tirmania nivea]